MRGKNTKVNIIFGCYSQVMEMQIVAVCCQNGDAENFILAGIGIFQLAPMTSMPLHCAKESWIKSQDKDLCHTFSFDCYGALSKI